MKLDYGDRIRRKRTKRLGALCIVLVLVMSALAIVPGHTLGDEDTFDLRVNEPSEGYEEIYIDGEWYNETFEWPYEEEYENNTEVDLNATSQSGWQFVEWFDETAEDTYSEDAETTVAITEAMNLTAHFEEVDVHTLTLNYNETRATVEVDGEVVNDGAELQYENHTVVDLEAISELGYVLENWTVNDEFHSDEVETNVTMDEDKTVVANFEEVDVHTLTVEYEEDHGTVMVDGEEVESGTTHDFENHTVVDLEAISELGYVFENWTINDEFHSDENVTEITMDDDKTVTANFAEARELTINYNETHGTVEVDGVEVEDGRTHEYANGTIVDLEAIPEEGFAFENWTVNDEHYSDENVTEITMDEDKTVVANFVELEEYELTINAEEGGTTNPEPGTYTYYEGEEVTVEAIPDEGWEFVEWTGDHESEDAEITVTMDDDKEITAVFEEEPEPPEEYDLTIEIEGEGTTDPAEGTHTYEEGEEVTITATADEGYEFVEWTGDVTDTDAEITVTMDDDKTITAHFEEEVVVDTYELTINIEGEDKGQVIVEWDDEEETVEDEHTFVFEEGTNVTLTAEALEDYGFVNWNLPEEDEIEVDEEIIITMDEDKELTARFGYEMTLKMEGSGSFSLESEDEVIFRHEQIEEDEWLITAVENTSLVIEAEAADGWQFSHWEGDYPEDESEEEEITITMDDHKELTAVFEEDELDTMMIVGIIIIIVIILAIIAYMLKSGGTEAGPVLEEEEEEELFEEEEETFEEEEEELFEDEEEIFEETEETEEDLFEEEEEEL